mmetsp:Transcript_10846/g.13721  ORF Transcript_10846/g.13721 Transcript_10846/m.13721 type:complete len:438 (-) Transcript_10846:274-1587(-)
MCQFSDHTIEENIISFRQPFHLVSTISNNTPALFLLAFCLIFSTRYIFGLPSFFTSFYKSIIMTATKIDHPQSSSLSISTNSDNPTFSAGYQYEYEVSPSQSTSKQVTKKQNFVVTETMVPATKTVFLIRHAESDENRRLACMKTAVTGLGRLKLPTKEDVAASLELVNVKAQIDSNVSPKGQEQIDQLGARLTKDNFVEKMGIQLVAHSPLKRARQTSLGMLGCVTPSSSLSTSKEYENDPSAAGYKHPAVARIVELDVLSERTPMEWLPINHDKFTKRIAKFEQWLSEQKEDVIAIVGHSQYFKSMLALESKFDNCDVWSLQFDFTLPGSEESVKEDVKVSNDAQRSKAIQKHLGSFGSSLGSASNDDITEENKDDEGDVDDDVAGDESREKAEPMTNSNPINEFDGKPLEELALPRGWRQLRHYYRYDSGYNIH